MRTGLSSLLQTFGKRFINRIPGRFSLLSTATTLIYDSFAVTMAASRRTALIAYYFGIFLSSAAGSALCLAGTGWHHPVSPDRRRPVFNALSGYFGIMADTLLHALHSEICRFPQHISKRATSVHFCLAHCRAGSNTLGRLADTKAQREQILTLKEGDGQLEPQDRKRSFFPATDV